MSTLDHDQHTLTVFPTAVDEIRQMTLQMALVEAVWGVHNPKMVLKCALSLSRQLGELFGMFFGSNSTVTRDGTLSLFVSTGTGFVFGMIGHPEHYHVDPPLEDDIWFLTSATKAPREGRYCVQRLADGKTCREPYRRGAATCSCEDPLPMVLPIPVAWSFHS